MNVYSPITLDEMSGISLMNRTDTKFVAGIERVRELLFMAKNDYFVQQTGGMRILSYYSVYFDTKTFDMYVAHQNDKLNRQKIRIRSYVDSGDNFLEVKTKNAYLLIHLIRLNRNTTLYFPMTFMMINQTVSIFSKNISIVPLPHLRSRLRFVLIVSLS